MANEIGKVVIVGGGIIGCSIAYHLTEMGIPCTLVERVSIACAASGHAGGFLARYCLSSLLLIKKTLSIQLFAKYCIKLKKFLKNIFIIVLKNLQNQFKCSTIFTYMF